MARKISRPAGRSPAPSQKPPRPRDKEVLANFFLGLILFLLAVLVFYPAFSAGFIWDDDQLLTSNPQVRSAAGWWTLWLRPETADYFPLTSTTLWIEYHLGQLFSLWNVDYLQRNANPDTWNGYHIMNVVFHAVTVVLTWQTLKRLRIPGAWIAAAIFAVHPICVESVAWISERKNTISQIFFLLSIIHYVRFEEKGRLWRYIAAILCFTLSLLAKTSVVMLPFILLILAWWRARELETLRASYELQKNPAERGILVWSCAAAGAIGGAGVLLLASLWLPALQDPWLVLLVALLGGGLGFVAGSLLREGKIWDSLAGFEVIRTIPFFLVAGVLGVVTVYFQYGKAIGTEEIPLGNLWQRAASACFATGFYLYSALWPFNIIEIYPQWHRAFSLLVTEPKPHWDPAAPESISYGLQVIPGLVIGGVLIFCWLRRKETWARAVLVGLGCYIVAMLPALGLLKMSYMRLTLVADHFQYISIIAIIALVVSAGMTRAMKPAWLFLAALFFLVVTCMNWGQTEDNHVYEVIWILGILALAAGSVMKEIWRVVWYGYLIAIFLCSTIVTWAQAGIYQSEGTLWSATLDKNPNSWQAHNHLGAWLYMHNDVKGAAPHFLRATQLKPENPESHNNLGLAYSMFGDMPDAISQYETAVRIKDDSAMETNLANAYEQVKRYDDAIRTYKHALELNPDNASAHCNMGYALMQTGKFDEAIEHFMKTIELDPQMPQGRADLSQALRIKGIDPAATHVDGVYSFDANKALELLHNGGPLPREQ